MPGLSVMAIEAEALFAKPVIVATPTFVPAVNVTMAIPAEFVDAEGEIHPKSDVKFTSIPLKGVPALFFTVAVINAVED